MNIPDIDIEIVKDYGNRISVHEETILLRAGETAKSAFFILSGGIRLFFYTEQGEVTLEFFFDNSVVSSFSSFKQKKPSNYWLETIEDSELIEIPQENVAKIFAYLPKLRSLYTEGLEDRLSDYISRLNTLLSLEAKDRYDDLVKKRPDIIQRVKQKYIASYIGIKPESLSRIRSNRSVN